MLVVLALAASALAQSVPTVHLLSDNLLFNGKPTVRSLLDKVPARRGTPFHLGAAWDPTVFPQLESWAKARARDTFNLGVAENFCKWVFNQPEQAKFNLTACRSTQDFWESAGADFRGHNAMWYSQLPAWLPGNFTPEQLQKDVIPTHVVGLVKMMGGNRVLDWDLTNEIMGENTTLDMSVDECVLNAKRWPNFDPMTGAPLIPDASFVDTVVRAARSAGLQPARMVLNDYGTGQPNAKTECYFKLLDRLESRGLKIGGLGFQSHENAASINGFTHKDVLKATFARLAQKGYTGSVTELDLWIKDNSTESLRFQAAIYGDYMDACLYSPNCREIVLWGMIDFQSWLNPFHSTGVSTPLLFANSTAPKPAYFEVLARLQNFVARLPEPCATAVDPACDPNALVVPCRAPGVEVRVDWAAPAPYSVAGSPRAFASKTAACTAACRAQLAACTPSQGALSCLASFSKCLVAVARG